MRGICTVIELSRMAVFLRFGFALVALSVVPSWTQSCSNNGIRTFTLAANISRLLRGVATRSRAPIFVERRLQKELSLVITISLGASEETVTTWSNGLQSSPGRMERWGRSVAHRQALPRIFWQSLSRRTWSVST